MFIPGATQTFTDLNVRFQNGIASIINRMRLLYGATPLEDMINYNVIVRMLNEWTTTTQHGVMDQTTISEGLGGWTLGSDKNGYIGILNTRNKYIQGFSLNAPTTGANFTGGVGCGLVPQGIDPVGFTPPSIYCTRRYQLNFALGVFNQDKLIPTKFMASQLAIELTLEQAPACIYMPNYLISNSGTFTSQPSYGVANFNLIPEILQFDASYGRIFYFSSHEQVWQCFVVFQA